MILFDTINRSLAAGKTTERDEEVLTKLAALLPSIKGDNLLSVIFVSFAGTILVDTINRSPAAGKTTERDEEVLTKLAALLPSIKGDNLFQELQTARFDIKGKI